MRYLILIPFLFGCAQIQGMMNPEPVAPEAPVVEEAVHEHEETMEVEEGPPPVPLITFAKATEESAAMIRIKIGEDSCSVQAENEEFILYSCGTVLEKAE